MFQALMPLLAQRTLIITMSLLGDDEIRINVVPKPLQSDQLDDGAALTTPRASPALPKSLTNN